MSALAAILRAHIDANGPILFRDFMQAALYDPAHGYYTSGRAAIGRAGDFFTNVSVGPLFGTLLARQFAEMWERLGRPAPFDIVEQGAHRGDFARDCLASLRSLAPECFAEARYSIVENSPIQRAAQEEALAEFGDKCRWLDNIEPFTGVHFSNELLDAFPVHLVTRAGSEWLERHVDFLDDRFVSTDRPIACEALILQLSRLTGPFPAGYMTEVNLAALAWADDVAAKLDRGFILAIDYGFSRDEFYHPARRTGTLTGYANHRRIDDVLATPGEIDITAHVEFTSVIERFENAGLRLHGFADQHHFMVGLSGLHFADNAAPTPEQTRELRAFKTLMHPALMGTTFKALCFEKSAQPLARLAAFRFVQ